MDIQAEEIKKEQAAAGAEQALMPEIIPEVLPEQMPSAVPAPEQPAAVAPVQPINEVVSAPEAVAPGEKSEDRKEIERILSQDLEHLYAELPETRREEFKQEGEKTAIEIEKLLSAPKPDVHKIQELIRKWLVMIPNVNKIFLTQDLKIKLDGLLDFKREKEGQL
ncbi:hypothetical protein KKC32_00435 [Patescibacteria group bacterium]|nr:hypothetical protein [Patescibacteria group bacterium]